MPSFLAKKSEFGAQKMKNFYRDRSKKRFTGMEAMEGMKRSLKK